MDALKRSTTTLPFALAALILVAGVCCLRAYAIFSAPMPVTTSGSAQEERLTALLDPIIGQDRVRVSIQKNAAGTRVWFIVIDGPPVPEGMRSGYLDPVRQVALARGFDPESDRLELVQMPFADGRVGNLSALEIAELGGLGLALLLLLGLALSGSAARSQPPETAAKPAARPSDSPDTPAAPGTAPINDNTANRAAILASAAPERSAALIRRWMQEDER